MPKVLIHTHNLRKCSLHNINPIIMTTGLNVANWL